MTTVPERFRQLLPAAVVAVAIVTGANAVAYPAIASAERVWDLEYFDLCLAAEDRRDPDPDVAAAGYRYCCEASGGVVVLEENGVTPKCVAPPADPQGTRSLPGNVQYRDIATAPTVNQVPPPRLVPSGIAAAPTVTAP